MKLWKQAFPPCPCALLFSPVRGSLLPFDAQLAKFQICCLAALAAGFMSNQFACFVSVSH
jgi:hypothetical protein